MRTSSFFGVIWPPQENPIAALSRFLQQERFLILPNETNPLRKWWFRNAPHSELFGTRMFRVWISMIGFFWEITINPE